MATVCFQENYFHEIPKDLQLHIMDIYHKKQIEEDVDKLNKKIQHYTEYDDDDHYFAKISGDIIHILWRIEDIIFKDDDEFYDIKHQIIDSIASGEYDFEEDNEDYDDDENYQELKKAVDYFGVLKAIKLGIDNYGADIFDFENIDEKKLYRQLYYHMLYDAFDFTFEDIKLIQEYNISTI